MAAKTDNKDDKEMQKLMPYGRLCLSVPSRPIAT
jgi:hypothetical protein